MALIVAMPLGGAGTGRLALQSGQEGNRISPIGWFGNGKKCTCSCSGGEESQFSSSLAFAAPFCGGRDRIRRGAKADCARRSSNGDGVVIHPRMENVSWHELEDTRLGDNSQQGQEQRHLIRDSVFTAQEGSQRSDFIACASKTESRDSLSFQRFDGKGEMSTLTPGRRIFAAMGFFGFLAISLVGECDAVVEGEFKAKPPKKKGRAPSSRYDEDRLLEQNRRMQKMNNAPTEFPGFVREGFKVKVIVTDQYVTSKTGLIYYDMVVGDGDLPTDGQQVIFHYTGYNESGRRVDSSYQQGRPARTRLGIQGMIPGFEEGIKTMRAGGRRIIIVPPELGPPVGPSTFFSAKQFEVFDVELLETKDCSRRTLLFYSDVVCD